MKILMLIRIMITLFVLLIIYPLSILGQKIKITKPSSIQYSWHEQERIMFVHFGPATWKGEEYDDLSIPLTRINPTKLNTDQWCEVAKSWGAKEIIFVAKHTGGFCWWQTKTTSYSIGNTPYKDGKGDVLKEISESCKKYNLNLGVYLSPQDLYFGAELGGRTRISSKQGVYNAIFRTQLTEILTKYGHITEVWFDGSCIIDVSDILEKHASKSVIFQGPKASIRWPGTESGLISYPAWNSLRTRDLKTGVATQMHSNPDGDSWAPLEADTPLYDHFWFWSPLGMKKRKSLEQLMECYYKSVGYGALILVNSTPDTTGLIPEGDAMLFKDFGNEINRRFNQSIKQITNVKGNIHTVAFDSPTLINHIVIMEDYREGERVREYSIEGLVNGVWKELVSGSSIGRKKIDYFPELKVNKIKLKIAKSVEIPIIRSFSAFYVEGFKGFKGSLTTSAWEPINKWQTESAKGNETDIYIDLSERISEPGQYLVKIDAELAAEKIKIENIELFYDGQQALDNYLKVENNIININRTAQVTVESSSILKFKIKTTGSAIGNILFRPAFVYKIDPPEFKINYDSKSNIANITPKFESDKELKIYYTTDGTLPSVKSTEFSKSIKLQIPTQFNAISIYKERVQSKIVFYKLGLSFGKKVLLRNEPNEKYKANGAASLTDGIHGKIDFMDGNWLGFEGDDFEATIDLSKIMEIKNISLSYLVKTGSWIFEPIEIIFETSEDGKLFRKAAELKNDEKKWEIADGTKIFLKEINSTKARYIKVKVTNRSTCPEGHPGFNKKAWIFIDEISVN